MAWKYNPFTDALDKVGSGGGSYIDGEVEYHSNLPVTVGTPAVNSAFLVRKGEGLYFISRKPAGIWVRELNNGNLDDWKFAGLFSDLYRDAHFRIINDTDITKELAFSLSGIATGTTRTITVPNKNILLDDAGDSRTPSAHAASHAAGGSDPVEVDQSQVRCVGGVGPWGNDETLADLVANMGNAIFSNPSDFAAATHSHAASDVTSGTLAHERGGLEADVSAYNGLVKISGGATSAVTMTTAGEALLDDVDAAAQRTTLGLGTAATSNTGDFAASSHSHGNLTSAGAIGTTAGLPVVTTTAGAVTTLALGSANQVLKVNSGGTAVEFGAAGGVTSGSVDNAVLRADGVGGSTSQSSDISILDATTSTQNNVAIANEHSGQTNSSLVLCNKGTGAFIVSPARPDGGTTGGSARGAEAVCIVPERNAANQVASGARAVGIGRRSRAAGADSVAIGSTALASGSQSVAVGGTSQSTQLNTICLGWQAIASAEGAVAIGNDVQANGFYAFAMGQSGRANNEDSIAIGGFEAKASANGAIALGARQTATGVNSVSVGYAVGSSTLRSEFATRPFRSVYWGGTTTDATANVVLNLDATATNRFTIAASTMVVADILIAANSTASGKASFWHYHVAIRRDGSNNTAIVGAAEQIGTTQTVGSPSGWSVALTADDTNEALQLAVTGEASTSITWRATAFYRVV